MKKQIYLCCVLLSVFFFPSSVYAQWVSAFSPYGRDGNSVYILNNSTAAIAGGNESNDSIRSIFMTTDRADNWNINLDVIKSWLKSVVFSSYSNGVAVGYDGAILKTTDGGINWSSIIAPGNTYGRHFNSVCFADSLIGYIAGGWPADDSIQTILKTTDGGSTWNIQSDNLGYWLRSISFSDALNGMAVGDHGTILKTTDGGSNWAPLTVPGNAGTRDYQSVYMLNSLTALIVGGNRSNDSIQTILKTTDGGSNWNVVLDHLGPMLKSIDFAGVSQAYIVGNRGVILHSTDKGDSWTPVNLPFAINDTMDLNAVNFYNADFGIAVGRFGKMLIYNNPLPSVPTVTTLQATNLNDTSATLQAEVNASGSFAAVSFEYGITPQLGTVVSATPDTVFGSTPQIVTAALTGLLPNTIYYFRVKAENEGGYNIGDEMQFFTGGCDIPNCSFEIWDTTFIEHPIIWSFVGYPHQVISYNGSKAVELTTTNLGEPSAVLFGNADDGFPLEGGVPISGQPDSLKWYAKYNIIAGDTAFAIVSFKKNDLEVYTDFFPITGSSGGSFVPMSWAMNFPNSTVPDTVVLGFINSNVFAEGSKHPNSILTIDEVQFTGISGSLPNWDFEQWDTTLWDNPNQWFSDESKNAGMNMGVDKVSKTTDRVSGNYAIRLENVSGKRTTSLSSGLDNFNFPSFAVGGKHTTFNFYAKYFPVNNDTLLIELKMFKGDSAIGFGHLMVDTIIPQYTGFSLPINYDFNSTLIPDSAAINISLGYEQAYGNSVVYFDNLSFDGFGPTVGIPNLSTAGGGFRIYPNPAQERLEVEWNAPDAERATITFTDINGRLLKTVPCDGFAQRSSVDIADLPAGFYLVSFRAGNSISYRKLIVSGR